MTDFYQQNWNSRFGAMGDEAEAIFDSIYPKHHKLGLNRPPFAVGGMPATMRYTPDRMRRNGFVEVQGIGARQELNIKLEKIDALQAWQQLGPVHLFIWDRTNKRTFEAPLHLWVHACIAHATQKVYQDGNKPYYSLKVEYFPVEGVAYNG